MSYLMIPRQACAPVHFGSEWTSSYILLAVRLRFRFAERAVWCRLPDRR